MAKINAFENYYKEYDNWFDLHQDLYSLELKVISQFIPENKNGVEIGVGTGRFAVPLKIQIGVEPSQKMAEQAKKQGIEIYSGTAESLPFLDNTFDLALMVTTVCFVDDVLKSFREVNRVLKTGGIFVIGFVDKESSLGKKYQIKKGESKFYKDAVFYTTDEILAFLNETNFCNFNIKQALFTDNGVINKTKIEEGYGQGSFIAIQAFKK